MSLATMLDTLMDEMFSQYIENGRYIELESKWLMMAYKDATVKYHAYHELQMKAKSGKLLDRMVDRLATSGGAAGPAATAAASAASSATSSAAAWLHKYGSTALSGGSLGSRDPVGSRGGSPAPNGPAPELDNVDQADGRIRLEVVERFLRIHAEATGRAVELGPGAELPLNTHKLAKLLSDDIGGDYLELSIDSAFTRLEAQEKMELDVGILGQIKQIDLALHLWQTYYSTALVPLISPEPLLRKEALQGNANTVTRVESKINSLIHRVLDGKFLFNLLTTLCGSASYKIVTIKAASHGWLSRSRNKRTMISSPRTRKCRLLERQRSPALRHATFWKRYETLLEQASRVGIWRLSTQSSASSFMRESMSYRAQKALVVADPDTCDPQSVAGALQKVPGQPNRWPHAHQRLGRVPGCHQNVWRAFTK